MIFLSQRLLFKTIKMIQQKYQAHTNAQKIVGLNQREEKVLMQK